MLRPNLKKLLLVFGDVALLYLSLLITVYLGFWNSFGLKTFSQHLYPFSILYFFWLVVFYLLGFYNFYLIKLKFRFYPKIVIALLLNFFMGIIFFYSLPFFDISPKTNLVLNLLIFGIMFIAWRILFWKLFSVLFLNSIAILGQGREVEELKAEIRQRPKMGFQLSQVNPQENLFSEIQKKKIDTVVFTDEFEADPGLLGAFYVCLPLGVKFLDISQAYEVICQKIPISLLGQADFAESFHKEEKTFYLQVKRAFDLIAAGLMLIISLPLWPIIALAIKFEDHGPVFYKQKRLGKQGKLFSLIKFRSMIVGAEKQGPQWADKQDKRVTKIGKFIRQSHLDEIPQMINILKGDISLVGPRPERPVFVKKLAQEIPCFQLRHSIKPGFTGWAQVKFGYARSVADSAKKFEYDLYYLKNRSITLDIGILLKTIKVLFKKD